MADNIKRSAIETYLIDNISIPDYFNEHIYGTKEGLSKLVDVNGSASCCPFHDDVNPSFRYWKQKKFFMCFGCSVAGDVINLHRLTLQKKTGRRVSRNFAIEDMCKVYGIKYKSKRAGTKKVEEPEEVETSDEKVVIEEDSVFDRCRKSLNIDEALVESRKHFSLNMFKRANQSIIKVSKNYKLETKFAKFDELDLQACVAIAAGEDDFQTAENMRIENIKSAI